jgi:hypothetical protein
MQSCGKAQDEFAFKCINASRFSEEKKMLNQSNLHSNKNIIISVSVQVNQVHSKGMNFFHKKRTLPTNEE